MDPRAVRPPSKFDLCHVVFRAPLEWGASGKPNRGSRCVSARSVSFRLWVLNSAEHDTRVASSYRVALFGGLESHILVAEPLATYLASPIIKQTSGPSGW